MVSTVSDIHAWVTCFQVPSDIFGQGWDKRGGIVGRGVLLDYYSWAQQQGVAVDAVSRHVITVQELEAVVQAQQVEFHPGDILVVRTGLMAWYQDHTDAERVEHITHGRAGVGVEASASALEWLWDHHFSAVASDSVGFEAWPKQGEVCKSRTPRRSARSSLTKHQCYTITYWGYGECR